MITELFTSFVSICTTLIISSTTAVGIFYWNNYPFFNPEGGNWKTILYTGTNLPLLLLESTIVDYYLQKYFIVNTVHSLSVSVGNCVLFSFGIELFFYFYHRLCHRPFFYRWIHRKHHENREVYPIDTFYLDPMDSTGLVLSLSIPVTMLSLNWYEYNVVLFVYVVSGFVSHSDLFYDHHSLHHKYRTCNYCFMIPIMDILCGTYR